MTLSWYGAAFQSVVLGFLSINGIMNVEKYHQMLIHHTIIPSESRPIDSDPKNTANAVKVNIDR